MRVKANSIFSSITTFSRTGCALLKNTTPATPWTSTTRRAERQGSNIDSILALKRVGGEVVNFHYFYFFRFYTSFVGFLLRFFFPNHRSNSTILAVKIKRQQHTKLDISSLIKEVRHKGKKKKKHVCQELQKVGMGCFLETTQSFFSALSPIPLTE